MHIKNYTNASCCCLACSYGHRLRTSNVYILGPQVAYRFRGSRKTRSCRFSGFSLLLVTEDAFMNVGITVAYYHHLFHINIWNTSNISFQIQNSIWLLVEDVNYGKMKLYLTLITIIFLWNWSECSISVGTNKSADEREYKPNGPLVKCHFL